MIKRRLSCKNQSWRFIVYIVKYKIWLSNLIGREKALEIFSISLIKFILIHKSHYQIFACLITDKTYKDELSSTLYQVISVNEKKNYTKIFSQKALMARIILSFHAQINMLIQMHNEAFVYSPSRCRILTTLRIILNNCIV